MKHFVLIAAGLLATVVADTFLFDDNVNDNVESNTNSGNECRMAFARVTVGDEVFTEHTFPERRGKIELLTNTLVHLTVALTRECRATQALIKFYDAKQNHYAYREVNCFMNPCTGYFNAQDAGLTAGVYEWKIVVINREKGGEYVPLEWDMGVIDTRYAYVAKVHDYNGVKALPEVRPVFKKPMRKSHRMLTLIFSIIVIIPWLHLLMLWGKVGALSIISTTLKRFTSSQWIFYCTFMSWMVLAALNYGFVGTFAAIKAGSILSLPTIIFGFKALRQASGYYQINYGNVSKESILSKMGINGLLPMLRSITRRVHLEQLAGESVAVDAYSWLHKGMYGTCAVDHFHSRPNLAYVDFCIKKVQQLLYYNVKPIMVFDGGVLPMKKHQEATRLKSRQEGRAKAMQLIEKGDDAAAYFQIQKTTDVTPSMAARLIEELRKAGIQYVVAPYEADAQMAWLTRTGKVSAVITEDSDLVLFGCPRVLFKLDKDGWCEEVSLDRLKDLTEFDFVNFSLSKLRHMCMLSGCDYLPSIYGIGLKTAYKYVSKYSDIRRVLQVMRAEMALRIPENYEDDFWKADLTFMYQRVYDMEARRMCFLGMLAPDVGHVEDWDFLGPMLPDEVARQICEGHVCPISLTPFVIPKPVLTVPDVSLQRSSQDLPFEILLDKPGKDIRRLNMAAVNRAVNESALVRPNIHAARLSIKRNYTTVNLDNQENRAPIVRPRTFAFSSKPLHLSGPNNYSQTVQRKVDPKQRSIRDFFKVNNKET